MEFLEKIEEFKQSGMYSVTIWYGEDVGADDSDIPVNERRFRLMAVPVGHLGEVKVLYEGTVKSFIDFDFKNKPTILGNPPSEESINNMKKKGGYYILGTERSVEDFMTKKTWNP